MAESNPMRWVVLGVVAAALFAVGLVVFVQSKVQSAKAQAAAEVQATEARVERADQQISADLERAAAVATALVADIGAGRFPEAYARLAKPYRAAVSLEAFAASCRGSPILKGARRVTFSRLRTQTSGDAATLEANGLLDSLAGAVPARFIFLQEASGPRVLVFSLAGVPVIQGVTSAR
jgi:hypothetical protein